MAGHDPALKRDIPSIESLELFIWAMGEGVQGEVHQLVEIVTRDYIQGIELSHANPIEKHEVAC